MDHSLFPKWNVMCRKLKLMCSRIKPFWGDVLPLLHPLCMPDAVSRLIFRFQDCVLPFTKLLQCPALRPLVFDAADGDMVFLLSSLLFHTREDTPKKSLGECRDLGSDIL
ncbi:MAG: hypothetical protein HRU33_04950 [Rhodobacteraceae bacterium]|nr:hypothetical protein [Paracoccaceae bacterium]